MADLAIDSSEDVPNTPLGKVMQVRLTSLGKYAMGLDKSYSPPERHSDDCFVLDTIRKLIILAEGYLFFVRKQDYSELIQLLKQYSYLL